MTPEKCGQILLQKLTRQIGLYEEMNACSARQLEFTRSGKEMHLPAMIIVRENIMARMLLLDKGLEGYRAYWLEHPDLFDAAAATAIRRKYHELEQQLHKLLCADAELEHLVQEKMSELRKRIGTTRQGKRVLTAYGKPALSSRPRFVSKLSQ